MAPGEKHTFLANFMAAARGRIDRAERLVNTIGPLDGQAVAAEVHSIWGEAAILNLPEVAQLAHEAESAARRLALDGSAEAQIAVASALRAMRQGLVGLNARHKMGETINTTNPTARSCRVLVVDDSPFAASALARTLEKDGFEVRSALHFTAAMEMCASFKPAVLVTDVFMPDMDVVELCKRFRQATRGRRTAILLVSAHSDSELKDCLRSTGANDFVPKSAGTAAVIRRVRELAREVMADKTLEIDGGTT